MASSKSEAISIKIEHDDILNTQQTISNKANNLFIIHLFVNNYFHFNAFVGLFARDAHKRNKRRWRAERGDRGLRSHINGVGKSRNLLKHFEEITR